MKILIALAMLALAGCAATGTQIQADCEKAFSAIGDIVSCTKSTLAQKNPGKMFWRMFSGTCPSTIAVQ